MPTLRYHELALRLTRNDQERRLEVRLLPGDHPELTGQSELPSEPMELVSVAPSVVRLAPLRNLHTGEPKPSKDVPPEVVGEQLFQCLTPGGIAAVFFQLWGRVRADPGRALRIRLILGADPGLLAIPWELAYHPDIHFLARNSQVSLIRHLDVRATTSSQDSPPPLRVVLALASPEGQEKLDLEEAERRVRGALGDIQGTEVVPVTPPTFERLRRVLTAHRCQVLHFIGHGDCGTTADSAVLVFEDAEGKGKLVTAGVFAEIVRAHPGLRLVYLDSCNSGRATSSRLPNQLGGVAAELVEGGVPAVLAMQTPISDRAAIDFSSEFYRVLAEGGTIEQAVVAGRREIFIENHETLEWAIPVLYQREASSEPLVQLPDSAPRFVDPPTAPASLRPDLHERALDHYEKRHYGKALEAFLQAHEENPDDPRVAYHLALSRLEGRRPRSARLDVIRLIEAELDTSSSLLDGKDPAHFWYLRALIKHDFYRMKGMRIAPISTDEMLAEAESAAADPAELDRLLAHVPTPPSPIREAIERKRLESAG